MIVIRPEQPADVPAVRAVNQAAFGQPAEAAIVDSLRSSCGEAVSLVALEDDAVVGHIMFSPVTIDGADLPMRGMGLAPMAVAPEHQRRGIGSQLVAAGIDVLSERKCPFIVVLGHPDYYPRFGFVPASRHGLRCSWDGVPDEAFLVRILDERSLRSVSGTVRYSEVFDDAL